MVANPKELQMRKRESGMYTLTNPKGLISKAYPIGEKQKERTATCVYYSVYVHTRSWLSAAGLVKLSSLKL